MILLVVWPSKFEKTSDLFLYQTTIFKTAIDGKLAEKCENSSFFVPKSTEDLQRITSQIKMDHLEQPVRIWTDYKRLNRTHFWSETAKVWWSDIRWKFKESVLVNGYKKLRNYRAPINGCCICVLKLEMKWHFKCLILFLVASLVFAIAGLTLRVYCRHHC